DLVDPEQDPTDELPDLGAKAVSHAGEIWNLGRHKLLCGDARDPQSFRKLMARDRAAMVFTDPPYNVRVHDIQGRGNIQHREFKMASGEMSTEQYTRFLT